MKTQQYAKPRAATPAEIKKGRFRPKRATAPPIGAIVIGIIMLQAMAVETRRFATAMSGMLSSKM